MLAARDARTAPSLLAFPAEYRKSGVMTFVVDADGTVHEKDLGERSGEIAATLVAGSADGTWREVTP